MSKYISNFPHGIMFHHFHDETHPQGGQGSISPDKFNEILNFIGIENILNPEEWVFKLRNYNLKENDVCITFDDGLRCQYDICVPILEKYKLRCFWFIYSSVFEGKLEKSAIYKYFMTRYFNNIDEFYKLFFEKYKKNKLKKINKYKFKTYLQEFKLKFPFYSFNDMKFRFIRNEILPKKEYEKLIDEIIEERSINITDTLKNLWLTNLHLKDLSEKGHFIGLHSYNHPMDLSKLSYNEQLDQYKKNYMHIKKICNKEVISMSHPVNSYNDDTLKILKLFGIQCGFRSNMIPPRGKKNNPNFLEIAREDQSNILKKIVK